jgi:hypothetical protein
VTDVYQILHVSIELVRRRGVSARGQPINVVSDYDLSETIKVSLLTSLAVNSPPIHVVQVVEPTVNTISCRSLWIVFHPV